MHSAEVTALLDLAASWEARCLSGTGFDVEYDPTWLMAARELRTVCAVVALLGYVGRLSER